MICKNCGNLVADGQRFCGVCGAKCETEDLFSSSVSTDTEMSSDASNQNLDETPNETVPSADGFTVNLPEGEVQPMNDFLNPPEEPKKKKKTWLVVTIIIAAVVAVIGLLAFIFWDTVVACWMHFMPADKQLQYTYYRFASNTSADAADYYEKSLGAMKTEMASDTVVSVQLNELAKGQIENALGVSLGEFDKVVIESSTDYNDTGVCLAMKAKIDKTQLAEVKLYVDMKKGAMIVDVPGLLEKPVKVDISAMQGVVFENGNSETDYMELLEKMAPDSKLIEKFLPRLIEVAFAQITDVDSEATSFKAGGVSQDATCLETVITQETLVDMGVAVIEELQENEDFNAYIEELLLNLEEYAEDIGLDDVDIDPDETIDQLKDSLKMAKRALKNVDTDDDELLVIKTYVDFHFNIVALEVEVGEVEFVFGATKDGSDRGFEIVAKRESAPLFEIKGKGTQNGGIYSGKFEVSVATDDERFAKILTFEIKDYDTDAVKDGVLKGSFEVFAESELIDALNLSDIDIASPSIKFTFDGKKDDFSKCTISLNVKKVSIVTLAVETKLRDEVKVKIPSNTVDSDDASFDESFLEDLVEKLEDAGLPIDEIGEMLGGSSFENETDSYYSDYADSYYY